MNITKNVSSTNPQFTTSYFAALLNYGNVFPGVADLDYKWMETWSFAKQLSPKSYATNDPEGKYHRPIKKRVVNNAEVLSNSLSGSILTVNFQDATFTGFRKGDVIYDTDLNKGRVIEVSPGQVLLEPHFVPTALTTSHFAAGMRVYVESDASGNFYSEGKTYLYSSNDVQTDYVAIQRDSAGHARREKIKTFIGANGTIMYTWSRDEKEMIDRAMKDYTKRFWLSEPGQKNSQYQGQVNGTRGVRRSIIQDGAAYMSGSGPITQNMFEDMVIAVSDVNGGSFYNAVEVCVGRNAYRTIAGFYPDQLAFTGSTNTAAGQVYNFNVAEINVAGIKCKIRPMHWMNDSETVPSWFSDSVYIMDTTPLPMLDGPGSVSPLIRIHFSEDNSADEIIYKTVPGMTGPMGNTTGGSSAGKYGFTASSIDGYSYQILMDNGISYVANAAALYEWKH